MDFRSQAATWTSRYLAPRAAPRRVANHDTHLLVHFGIRKTGSTSIQETLYRNQDRLGDSSYISFGMANSSLMMRHAFPASQRPLSDRDEGARARFESTIRRAVRTPKAILSAETISDLDGPTAKEFISTLKSLGMSFSFVGYLRDPVSYCRSAYQERLKHSVGDQFPFAADRQQRRNYHRIVKVLDDVAGQENVNVYPFETEGFPTGDVVSHFLSVAGITQKGIVIRRTNDALSLTAVKALYTYRRMLVQNDTQIGCNRSRDPFIDILRGLKGPRFALAPEIEQRIAEHNAELFDWSEARIGKRLEPRYSSEKAAIRSEQDLMTFSSDELLGISRLGSEHGLKGLPARAGSEAVAHLMHDLRLQCAVRIN